MTRTKPKKLKGNKKYVDAPRFKAIYGYEDVFKKQFSNIFRVAIKEVNKHIKANV